LIFERWPGYLPQAGYTAVLFVPFHEESSCINRSVSLAGTLAALGTPMTRVALLSVALPCVFLACSQSTPPIDTPATLPPAERPADVTRSSADKPPPDKAADSGKPEQQVDAKPVQNP
jgi:hypothetical protein